MSLRSKKMQTGLMLLLSAVTYGADGRYFQVHNGSVESTFSLPARAAVDSARSGSAKLMLVDDNSSSPSFCGILDAPVCPPPPPPSDGPGG